MKLNLRQFHLGYSSILIMHHANRWIHLVSRCKPCFKWIFTCWTYAENACALCSFSLLPDVEAASCCQKQHFSEMDGCKKCRRTCCGNAGMFCIWLFGFSRCKDLRMTCCLWDVSAPCSPSEFLSFPPVEDDRAWLLSLLFVWGFFFLLVKQQDTSSNAMQWPTLGFLLSWQCQRISEAARHEVYKTGMKEHIEVL